MSGSRQMTRSAGVIGASTLLSRVLGFIRDVIMAGLFGTTMIAEAFNVANMIPALMRRLVGEGSLTVAFIPVYTRLKEEKGEEEARQFLNAFWTLMSMVLVVLVVLTMVFSREVVWVFTNPDFRARFDGEQFTLAYTMTRLISPYLFFIGLTALAMGVLNSHKRFFAPAFHPVLLNASWVTAIVVLEKFGGIRHLHQGLGWEWLTIPGLPIVIGLLIGGTLQFGLQAPFLIGVGMRFRPSFKFRHPAIIQIGRLMLPSFFAVGIVQINTIVATYFVTAFAGGRTQIFQATRITEFPYALISLAFATVALPTLADHLTKGNLEAFSETFTYGLKTVYFVMLPASIGLAFLGHPFIHIAFEHGKFNASDTAATANILTMLCVGIWAVGGTRMVLQPFYAHQDMKTPLYAAGAAMVANGLGCYFLSPYLMSAGVAISISMASILNLAILWQLLKRRVPGFSVAGLSRTVTVSLAASLPMALWVQGLNLLSIWDQPGRLVVKTAILAVQMGGGGLLFAAGARLLKAPELDDLIGAFARKMKR